MRLVGGLDTLTDDGGVEDEVGVAVASFEISLAPKAYFAETTKVYVSSVSRLLTEYFVVLPISFIFS